MVHFDCVGHNKLWKILKEMGIPEHLTCLLRNLYAGQEATVRTGHGTTVWFQIVKGVCQGCILSLCLFNLYQVVSCAGWDEHSRLFLHNGMTSVLPSVRNMVVECVGEGTPGEKTSNHLCLVISGSRLCSCAIQLPGALSSFS